MQLAHSLLTYLPAAVIVTLLPGPDTALILGISTRHGVRPARRAALGIGAGLMVWAVAVAVGLAGALRASAGVYEAFRWCCAAYLLYLAASALIAARRRDAAEPPTATTARESRTPPGFRLGLLTAALNPKLGVFFVTMLPQFIPASAPVVTYTLALVALHAACAVGWFFLLARLAEQGQQWLSRNRVQRWITRSTAAAFTAFGLRTAFFDG